MQPPFVLFAVTFERLPPLASGSSSATWWTVTNCSDPAKLEAMLREISAGGVVVRGTDNAWQVAVIEPQKEAAPSPAGAKRKSQKVLYALPKGLVNPGEKPEQAALREVREETGVTAVPIIKLSDIKYVYVRTWGDRERVFKIVSFYLLRYRSGEIDDIAQEMRIEVRRALWLPLEEAAKKLGYGNERKVIRLAQQYLSSHLEA
jgi:8-oxo-dGTP pyrophosphatase MutT (NUDIX family)